LLRQVLHSFKYEGKTFLARALVQLLQPCCQEIGQTAAIDFVVPVPLHRTRLRTRGFNQAAILAHHLGRDLKIPVKYQELRRVRQTDPQVGLSRSQRRANVRGAFRIRGAKEFKGKTLLLVDDVMTTGETVNQCAQVLKRHGAKTVFVLTVARTAML